MSNTIRIKRRASGGAGAPASLNNAELAFNEVDSVLYYGVGTGGAGGTATTVLAIGGPGAFMALTGNQTIAGVKTFSSAIQADIGGNAATATKLLNARTLSLTGDGTASITFDGSANASGALTLATVNSNVGTFTKFTVNAKGLITAASQASRSDLSAPTADISNGGFKITNVAEPTLSTDAATKNYVDSVAQGLDVKASAVVATTANITLSGTQTIDGVAVVAGDRVLVKNQSTASANGIYVVAAGAWTRSTDADTWAKLVSAFVFVEKGTVGADTGWVSTIDSGGTLGSTAVTFSQFSGAGTYTAGTGLTLTGTQFSITNTAVTAGSYGSTSKTLTLTVNAQGQLTAVAASDIAIANTQVSGLGTMSTQNANSVAITGGSITNLTTFDGITIDGGTF